MLASAVIGMSVCQLAMSVRINLAESFGWYSCRYIAGAAIRSVLRVICGMAFVSKASAGLGQGAALLSPRATMLMFNVFHFLRLVSGDFCA